MKAFWDLAAMKAFWDSYSHSLQNYPNDSEHTLSCCVSLWQRQEIWKLKTAKLLICQASTKKAPFLAAAKFLSPSMEANRHLHKCWGLSISLCIDRWYHGIMIIYHWYHWYFIDISLIKQDFALASAFWKWELHTSLFRRTDCPVMFLFFVALLWFRFQII